jgi:GDPmannose 4,6-dehydratase
MKKKIALITGITGQDGSFLAEFLLEKGYEVHGIKRKSSSYNTSRIDHIYIDPLFKHSKFYLHYGDLTDSNSLIKLIKKIKPQEIYNLAAQSHVGVSFELPEYTANVNALGTLRILEAIRILGLEKQTKFYQASTSELFGSTKFSKQNEKTPFYPVSPYATSKLFAYWITLNYREAYKIYACNGILFNHESERRGETFVTRKITMGLSRVLYGTQNCIYLGNLNSLRDWGYAKEYARMQWRMLQNKRPKDYVIATGKQYSVRKFVEECCKYVGIHILWSGKGLKEKAIIKKITTKKKNNLKEGDVIVAVDKKYFRPHDVDYLIGDSSKAKKELKWKYNLNFSDLVKKMMDYDLESARKELK